MSKGFRNFFITFILALIAFGFIAYRMVPLATDFILSPEESSTSIEESNDASADESNTSDESSDVSEVEQIEGSSFTSLILGKDLYGNIDAAMLIKVNKETKTYVICSIPTDMQLEIDGIDQKLKHLLVTRDISFFKDKITAITGLKVDYYAILDIDGLINIVDTLDDLYFNVPYDMYYEDPEQSLVIDLKQGRTRLTGDIVSQLVRYVPQEGELGRLELQRDLIQSMFVQMLTLENISKAPTLIENMLQYAETDFTLDDFNSNSELIFKYSSFTKMVVEYPGTMKTSEGDTYFAPNIDYAISMFKDQK